ncbi:hypothetical protein, variant [Blastomyces dermatitidis ER-3]|uniref:Zn(2)-C6 fungal-type domain-containing protein n=3 Tax=Blastomyces TaxID=229219 RepID=A0A179UXH0_BLAGS|nr:uncharacterized protein BDBG_07231 [Blastomyces gilchristii SLH14081]XP_045282733.1 uncharacterized protein BDCG_08918 [Blastomyces dermatitidis ER-3]XP_045282734.1 hypothetical protein, variant [Blastomyces dermatitidis ER-3]EQL34513.1 hypothetical protein BDFG_03661 [Blastomyces dermatitidis ATCC 26199]KMW67858.1 hypothetical protein BDDG_12384 [Blastomyces dermatitidis ATCC 18188]EQL34514.1 hypothetical protein, variant [Blastomyces dermatitidis ATCC 26199]KMW67859.1 hypothetical protei
MCVSTGRRELLGCGAKPSQRGCSRTNPPRCNCQPSPFHASMNFVYCHYNFSSRLGAQVSSSGRSIQCLLHLLHRHMTPTCSPLHKGTRSCWECKLRKMKCRFDPRVASMPCNGCRRRDSRCISQDFPEDLPCVPMGIRSVRNGSHGAPFDGSTPAAATPSENGRADPNIVIPMSNGH